jgi:hypothetical protein
VAVYAPEADDTRDPCHEEDHRYALIHTGGKNWLLHLTKEQPGG